MISMKRGYDCRGDLLADENGVPGSGGHGEDEQVEKEESDNQSTYHIQQMAKHFVRLSVASSRDDDGTSEVAAKCKQLRPSETGVDKRDITANDLSKLLKEEKDEKLREKYANLWLLDLKSESQVKGLGKISYENCTRSMVKAQKNCLALGHSLSDAKKVVKVLNKVMTALLGAIVMVAWLLLTDIATNRILVLIASPFLAATFIFGKLARGFSKESCFHSSTIHLMLAIYAS